MTNENLNWQEKPEEGASSAGREATNRFRNSYGDSERMSYDHSRYGQNRFNSENREARGYNNDNRGYGQNGYNRPRRNYEQNSYAPKHSYGEHRSNFRSENTNEESQSDNNYNRNYRSNNSYDRPRRSYNQNDRSNYSSGNRNYNSRGEGRSYYDNNRSGEGRPYSDRSGGYDRPRRQYNNEGGRGYNSNRPYNNNNFDRNNQGGYSRPRPNFADEPAKSYATNRADGRPKRPRIKKTSYNPDSSTAWLAENDFKAPKYSPNIDPSMPIRLNKFLSNAGVCSRREADEFIQAGVVKVNGELVTELGVKVMPSDEVMFHDQPVKIERKVYILLNKPKDCVTTSEDPQERLTVMDLVKNACYERIYPVGRLDRNTTGVLLLTNDGDLASKLAHPKYEKRKIYQATLDRDLPEETKDEIAKGVELDGEHVAVDEISYVNEKKNVIGIEIHSGQNRVVRRIFEQFGYKVFRLDRVYFAGLTKKNLARGKWRHLTEKEVSLLKMGVFA